MLILCVLRQGSPWFGSKRSDALEEYLEFRTLEDLVDTFGSLKART